MSGYEVCRRLRINYSMDELPVIMLTAKIQKKDIDETELIASPVYLSLLKEKLKKN